MSQFKEENNVYDEINEEETSEENLKQLNIIDYDK